MSAPSSAIDTDVVGAAGVPVGRATKGGVASVRADHLAALVVAAALGRSGLDPGLVDDHVLGCGYPEGEQGSG